ncbi:hypothetical protein [Hyphococcus sp.]|uniref:hypothetical protein n=1 Tax=Hyphococcus sp. TaxID=2038636 RepID=UPI00207DD9D4|nr:MAG: hypothetical protein DHS20C04_19030 [Marinicaulis sp.]
MRHSFTGIIAAVFCFAFTAPAFAQFTGGVFVAAGDITGDSSASLSAKLSSNSLKFQASNVTFGANRSARPPSARGSGVAQITLKRGYTESVDRWFQSRTRKGANDGGKDLLIVNNGDGSDFLAVTFSDVFVTSYQTSAGGASATIKYRKLNITYTVQADDHSAN